MVMRLALLFLMWLAAACAAPLEIDLGQRLHYHRIRTLPADLPATAPLQARVIDLRFTAAGVDEAAAMKEWFKTAARPKFPVFVLTNQETSGELLRILNELYPIPGVLTIGVVMPLFEPDVSVRTSVEDERRAYEALAAGTPAAAILSDNPGKPRIDETSLSRDRAVQAAPDPQDNPAGNGRPGPPVDVALQRAVHLHQSLLALKRI